MCCFYVVLVLSVMRDLEGEGKLLLRSPLCTKLLKMVFVSCCSIPHRWSKGSTLTSLYPCVACSCSHLYLHFVIINSGWVLSSELLIFFRFSTLLCNSVIIDQSFDSSDVNVYIPILYTLINKLKKIYCD